MFWGQTALALLGVLALLLLVAAATDIAARTIANRLNLAIALLAPAYWAATGLPLWPGVALQIGAAAVLFALLIGAFAMGWMGGGDVKLLGALALWLPGDTLAQMLIVMSVAGGVVTLAVLIVHRLRRLPANPEIPYGVAIAFAGLWAIYERYLNQFA